MNKHKLIETDDIRCPAIGMICSLDSLELDTPLSMEIPFGGFGDIEYWESSKKIHRITESHWFLRVITDDSTYYFERME